MFSVFSLFSLFFRSKNSFLKKGNQTGSIASSFCASFAFSMYVVSSRKIALQVQVYMRISIQSCMRFLCGFTLILDLIKI